MPFNFCTGKWYLVFFVYKDENGMISIFKEEVGIFLLFKLSYVIVEDLT